MKKEMRERRKEFYLKGKRIYEEMYWGQEFNRIIVTNGFTSYPKAIYDQFVSIVKGPGKILDLGCGNGLLLRHIVKNSRFKIIPFGVDFIKKSIEQARTIVFPEHKNNFKVCNFIDFDFPGQRFNYIIFTPYDLYLDDWKAFFKKLKLALLPKGQIIFYCYSDVLGGERREWVGDFPILKKLKIRRIDGDSVSFGLYQKAGN